MIEFEIPSSKPIAEVVAGLAAFVNPAIKRIVTPDGDKFYIRAEKFIGVKLEDLQ